MYNILGNEKGVTLIEIIVSIAILVIIVTPLSNMFLTAARTNIESKNLLTATHAAQQLTEEKLAGVNAPADIASGFSYSISDEFAGDYSLDEDQPSYHATIQLEKNGDNIAYIKESDTSINDIADKVFKINIPPDIMQIYFDEYLVSQIDYSDNWKDYGPVKINVECYEDVDIKLQVANQLDENIEVYLYIVKMVDDDYTSTSEVDIDILEGEVRIRNVKNMQGNDFESKKILREINVKVSEGSYYSDDDKLIEIKTLKKD